MTPTKKICFFQSSRFDSLASLVAAHNGLDLQVIEVDDENGCDDRFKQVLDALFSAESVQSW